jgi:hypothetical protein
VIVKVSIKPRNGGRFHFGTVAGFKSEARPASCRNTRPPSIRMREASNTSRVTDLSPSTPRDLFNPHPSNEHEDQLATTTNNVNTINSLSLTFLRRASPGTLRCSIVKWGKHRLGASGAEQDASAANNASRTPVKPAALVAVRPAGYIRRIVGGPLE